MYTAQFLRGRSGLPGVLPSIPPWSRIRILEAAAAAAGKEQEQDSAEEGCAVLRGP